MPALDEQTLGLLDFLMLLHQAPKVLQPCAFEGAEQHHGGLPGRVFDVRVGVRCKQAQCTADVGLCASGCIGIEICFVDQDQVGQLHDALFDGLQIVTGIGQLHQGEQVRHARHSSFTLAHTHRFNDHHIVSSGLAHQNAFAGFFRHAPQITAAGAGPNEGRWVHCQMFHPGFIAQDRSA